MYSFLRIAVCIAFQTSKFAFVFTGNMISIASFFFGSEQCQVRCVEEVIIGLAILRRYGNADAGTDAGIRVPNREAACHLVDFIGLALDDGQILLMVDDDDEFITIKVAYCVIRTEDLL